MAIAGILIGNNIVRLKAGIAAATEAWRALEPLGLALGTETLTGLAARSGDTRPILAGTIGSVACTVQIVSDFVQYAHTKVTATPPSGADVSVGVHPNPAGLFGKIRGWLGQDIIIGDPDFDDAFLITGKPASAAANLLTPALRERIVALAASSLAGFVYERDEVVVLLTGIVTDPVVLGAAIELACDVAR